MTAASTSARRSPMMLLGLAYAAFISLGLPDGLTGVAWPSLRAAFGLPLNALGALATTGMIGYLISSFTNGRVLARIGVGWLLALSCLITAISLLGYGATPIWGLMVGLGFLAGLGAGAIDAGLNTYAADNFSPRTVNWLHASFGLGAATGPLIMTGVISGGLSWRIGYLIVGVAQLLLAGCFTATRALWQVPIGEGHAAPVAIAPMGATLRRPSTWLGMLMFFLYTGVEFSAGQWLYTFLTATRGMGPGLAGLWVSLYWGSLTVGRLLSGFVVAHISTRAFLHLCMGGAIAGVTLIWLTPAPWLFAGIALLGLSLAPMFPSFIALTPARMGPAHAANAVGFQVAAAVLGGTALVSGFGQLADWRGLETFGPYLLVAALLLSGVFLILEHAPQRSAGDSA